MVSSFEDANSTVPSSGATTTANIPKKHKLEPYCEDLQADSKKLRGLSSTNSNVLKKKSNGKSSKKPTSLIQPPPPIPRSDIRYTYTRLLLSAFNSCDPVQLQDVLSTYTTEDVVSIHRSEGDHSNPLTSSYCRLDGRQTTIQMWIGLFKSAPDFFFQIRDTRIFHSPDWNVIVASKFDWVGTRVSDVSLAKSEGEGARALPSADDANAPIHAQRKVVVEPVFQGKEQLSLEQGESLVLESKPCERKEIRCSGRILLHLTTENKIMKIEFIYSSSSGAESKSRSLPTSSK